MSTMESIYHVSIVNTARTLMANETKITSRKAFIADIFTRRGEKGIKI